MADQLRGGSTVGGYEIVTTKEVPMIFRVDSGNLQYSEDNGITWSKAVSSNDTTATAAQILSGYTAYVAGNKTTGTMTNRGAVSQALAINGSYTIPEGYHNGAGKVTQSITTKAAATITPKTTNQTIAAGTYLSGIQTIAGDADLIAANIKKAVNIFNIVGTAPRYANGTASTNPITVTLGWQPKVVIVRQIQDGGLFGGFWCYFAPTFWYRTQVTTGGDGYYVPYTYSYPPTSYNLIRMYGTGASATVETQAVANATGFTITCNNNSGSSFEWYAYE